MDDMDRAILEVLRRNSRESFTAIANEVHTSEATVRARVKRLVDDGVIEKFTIRTGAGNVQSIVHIALDVHADAAKIAQELSQWDGVESVWEVTGDHDMILLADCENARVLNDLLDRIRSLEGAQSTRSQLILTTH